MEDTLKELQFNIKVEEWKFMIYPPVYTYSVKYKHIPRGEEKWDTSSTTFDSPYKLAERITEIIYANPKIDYFIGSEPLADDPNFQREGIIGYGRRLKIIVRRLKLEELSLIANLFPQAYKKLEKEFERRENLPDD